MKKLILICSLALCAVLLFSCAALAPQASSSYTEAAESVPEADYVLSEAAAAPDGSGDTYQESGISIGTLPNGTKLSYHASYDLNTDDFSTSLADLKQMVKTYNGYIENAEQSQYTSAYFGQDEKIYKQITLTARIPSERFESFTEALPKIGEVTSMQQSTENHSEEYYDTKSRIALLEARKERLMGYLETATKTEDIIALERDISDVLYEIDQLQSNVRGMDSLIDYSTVSISMFETEDIMPKQTGNLSDRTSTAFASSAANLGIFFENFAVGFVAAVPVLLFIGAIVAAILVIVWLVRRRKTKSGK